MVLLYDHISWAVCPPDISKCVKGVRIDEPLFMVNFNLLLFPFFVDFFEKERYLKKKHLQCFNSTWNLKTFKHDQETLYKNEKKDGF